MLIALAQHNSHVSSNVLERIGSIIDTMLGEEMLTRENGQLAVSESEPPE
jgi:hypothetical protein